MKKVLSLFIALLLSCTFISAFAEDKTVLTAKDAEGVTGISMENDKITGFKAGRYVKFKNVDLTGVKSIKVYGNSFFQGVGNCEIFQVRIDSGDKGGELLGYVKFDENGEHVFSTNIKEVSGVHDLYLRAQFTDGIASRAYAEIYSVTLSDEYIDDAYVPVGDDKIIDNYSDTWTATDPTGLSVADYEETGPVKGDRYVGMFFWNWHTKDNNSVAYLPWKIVEQYPDAENNYNHEAWDPNGRFFWNEPVFGYYFSTDYWVYRKQAVLLANAGVDVVFFDHTNGPSSYFEGLKVHMQAWRDARESGVNAPKISSITSWKGGRVQGLKFLYEEYFKDGQYSDLWFYWEGKPLILTDESLADQYEYPDDPIDRQITDEAFSFFSMRRTGSRVSGKLPGDTEPQKGGQTKEHQYAWLDNYPQYPYSVDENGRAEIMSAGIAVNESYVWGMGITGVFSDPYTKGRSYTEAFGEDFTEGSYKYNYFFKAQASRVLDSDPKFVFIDGWNEWTAGRQQIYSGVENAFVDTYDDEGSRDIEPTKGPLKDYSYTLFVDFVRKYKGVRPAPSASGKTTIDINGSLSQWDSVEPEFINDYDDYERDSYGLRDKDTKEPLHYTTKVNNSISRAKVARDDENFYFMVKTTRDIKTGTENWMNLYINADRNYATGWEGYEYTVNVNGPGVMAKNTGKDFSWQNIGTVNYKVSENTLTLVIPKTLLGGEEIADLEFKWTDSVNPNGDIVEFYSEGSVAPMGRFNYLYTEIEQTALTKVEKENLFETSVLKAGKNKMIVSGGKMKVYDADSSVTCFEADGTLYIPVQALNDILGNGRTKVEYDADDNMLFVSNHELEDTNLTNFRWTYTVLGSKAGAVNGYDTALSHSAIASDGVIYVPITYLAECFGLNLYNSGNGLYAVSRYSIDETLINSVAHHLD